MNICIVTPGQFNPFVGGIDSVCSCLSQELLRLGHTVVCCYLWKSVGEVTHNGIQLSFPDNKEIESNDNISFLYNVLQEYQIDILWNHSFLFGQHRVCVKAKLNTNVKLVHTYHTDPQAGLKQMRDNVERINSAGYSFSILCKQVMSLLKYPIGHRIRKNYISARLKSIYNESDAYVLLSECFKKNFISISGIRDTSKLFAITNPVAPITDKLPSISKKNQILFVGRLNWQKRLDRILKIWRNLYRDYPDWSLFVVGDGPDRDLYESISKRLNLDNINFVGTQSSEFYYAESKILCMASSYEGFGLTLIEAMAHGCVPIAYDSYEALGDIIGNEKNGFAIPAFDQKEYSRKLCMLMDNENLRYQMSLNGANVVKAHDVKVVVNLWIELFSSLIKK